MNWGYIAGFTDGEGHIVNKVYTTKEKSVLKSGVKYYQTSRHRRRIVLTQSQKQVDVLYQIAKFLNKELDTNIRIYDRGDKCSQLMVIRKLDVYRMAKMIVHKSIVKKQKIEQLLDTYENPELLSQPVKER